jgi:hypothetical protein
LNRLAVWCVLPSTCAVSITCVHFEGTADPAHYRCDSLKLNLFANSFLYWIFLTAYKSNRVLSAISISSITRPHFLLLVDAPQYNFSIYQFPSTFFSISFDNIFEEKKNKNKNENIEMKFCFSHLADCSSYATCLFNAFDPQRKGYLTFEV